MIRRMFTIAAALSLLASALLAIASFRSKPGRGSLYLLPGGRWALVVENGMADLDHDGWGIVSVPVGVLPIPFAVPPLVWVLIKSNRVCRRRRERGFPVGAVGNERHV